MRHPAVTAAVIVLLYPVAGRGAEAADAAEPQPTAIRTEMLSEYRYVPAGAKPAALPTSLRSDAPLQRLSGFPVRRDVVAMAPFEVRASGAPAGLTAAVVARDAREPATVASKLGIGVHTMKVGKVQVFVETLFYIPFLAGFAW